MNSPPVDTTLAGTGYVALRELGRGGFGVVYEARDPAGNVCAVKVLLGGTQDAEQRADRLRLEAETLQCTRSPHIVKALGSGRTASGHVYYAMERLEGQTLAALLQKGGRLPLAQATRFILQALDGIDEAHRLGVVHRDLKPENLFVCSDGVLKILDFGIAKVVEPERGGPAPLALPTAEGWLVGSLRWCSPEAIASLPVDARADIYSLGLVFHAMLTGRAPWPEAREQIALVRAQLTQPLDTLEDVLGGEYGPPVDELIATMTEKKPEARFASAGDAAMIIRQKIFYVFEDPECRVRFERAPDPAPRVEDAQAPLRCQDAPRGDDLPTWPHLSPLRHVDLVISFVVGFFLVGATAAATLYLAGGR